MNRPKTASNTTTADTPRLAQPGAGIPPIERLIGGTVFAFRRRRGTRDGFVQAFSHERSQIRRMIESHDKSALGKRVLIPRLRGLEDSSRHWSVYMTLDHLRIVNDQIAMVMAQLVSGSLPVGEASTAAVKPSLDVGSRIVADYESSCDTIIRAAQCKEELRGTPRYAHPWFGPLDAFGWLAMAAVHMAIHRAQIERILAERVSS